MDNALRQRLDLAILARNPDQARHIILQEANRDLASAKRAYDYAVANMRETLQAHDGAYPIESERSAWNVRYWAGVYRDLRYNFSAERFAHLLEVTTVAKIDPKSITLTSADEIDVSALSNSVKARLDEALGNNDLNLVRSIIRGQLNSDLQNAMLAFFYAVQRNADVLLEHNELYKINPNKAEWNEQYYHGLTRDLMYNFSRERFEHVCEVVAEIWPERLQRREARMAAQAAASSRQQGQQSPTLVYVVIGLALVVAIPLLIWLWLKK